MKTLPLVVAVTALSLPSIVRAQAARDEGASAPPAIAALAAEVKVKLDNAIGIATKARAGFAAGVELESRKVEGKAVPVFEIMVVGDDGVVYEVFVNAVDGAVVANDACKDEDDVAECKALSAGGPPRLALADVVAEARAMLRGTCIGAELNAKEKVAKVVLMQRGRRLTARWSLANGELRGVAWVDRAQAERESDQHGERAEGAKAKKGKKAKGESGEEHEEEESEGGEHGEKAEGAKAKKGKEREKNE